MRGVRVLMLAGAMILAGAAHGAMADPGNGNGYGNGGGNGNGYGWGNGNGGGHGNNHGAPLPVAGVGLPVLAAAGLYFAIRNRRRG